MEKKNEKGKVQLKGQLKLYIQWPAIMSLLLIAMDLWVYKLDHRALSPGHLPRGLLSHCR